MRNKDKVGDPGAPGLRDCRDADIPGTMAPATLRYGRKAIENMQFS